MMEIERLKSLKLQEERQVKRKEAQKQGSLVIIDQIKERELDRIKDQETREREMHQMHRQAEQLKTDEHKLVQTKKERAVRMMGEVEESNKRAIEVKDQRKREEKDLEQQIIDYNRHKILREEEKQAETKRVKEEKEREVGRLRELQEKAADRQAEIDALRAKRAFEEGER